MATASGSKEWAQDHEAVRGEWFGRLEALASDVRRWAEETGWSARSITKKMEDSQLGVYEAPALLLQKETVRVLLEPIARSAPGADGVVDLYLMPAYDDIASLYLVDGVWQLHYMFDGAPVVATIRQAESVPLDREALGQVLDAMSRHAA